MWAMYYSSHQKLFLLQLLWGSLVWSARLTGLLVLAVVVIVVDRVSIERMCAGKEFQVEVADTEKAREFASCFERM